MSLVVTDNARESVLVHWVPSASGSPAHLGPQRIWVPSASVMDPQCIQIDMSCKSNWRNFQPLHLLLWNCGKNQFVMSYNASPDDVHIINFRCWQPLAAKLNSAQLRRQASCQCQSRLCSGYEGSHTMYVVMMSQVVPVAVSQVCQQDMRTRL